MSEQGSVAIIGGGYAGMAAAAELAARHQPLTIFEASRVLGGRARAVASQGDSGNFTLDNGQHILIGAYHETLRLMRLVGASPEHLLLRQNLHLEFPGALRLHAPRLPAPLHLLCALLAARGLSISEKLAALRFMQGMQARKFQLPQDMTVQALLDDEQQPAQLCHYLWNPLCIAALNTPAELASAQVFLNVLRDTLAAGRSASDLLLPRVDLGRLFPDAAARFMLERSQNPAALRTACPVRRIDFHPDGSADSDNPHNPHYTLHGTHGVLGHYDQIILAVAPQHLTRLLPDHPGLTSLRTMLSRFQYQPILTGYLAYPPEVRLSQPMLGQATGLIQWLFDRGQLDSQHGLLAAVTSAAGHHLAHDHHHLATRIHEEIAALIPALPSPLWTRIITEKRATWSCTPGLERPTTRTALPGLLLAGDYVASDYPATLESAIRSGVAAAALASRTPSGTA
ncbi:MAG: hydroxysqualene dehydroxylase HpnE [Sterolibacterium sp.]|nr:hydroxysqualene dehydroxylase HpnE [Sterolibacterium sp.]MBP9799796.1 hydroxysqualene dehydroxylase HpnE [Sterolibacterium sp.]